MITFDDGPAQGQRLELMRSPVMLRVVRNAAGEWDALDMLDDEAKPDEEIWLYEMVSQPSSMHVCRSPRRLSGWIVEADYQLFPDPPPDPTLRSNPAFVMWCEREKERIFARRNRDGLVPSKSA